MTAPQLQFRRATAADVPAVVALVESAYRGDSSRDGWTTEADLLDGQRTDAAEVSGLVAGSASASASASAIVLAWQEELLVGSVAWTFEPPGTVHVGMFAVRPGMQGQSIGRALLQEVERIARDELHASRLRMTVIGQRRELIAWYERRGFRRAGQREPFPYGDERFGLPRRSDLYMEVLEKATAR